MLSTLFKTSNNTITSVGISPFQLIYNEINKVGPEKSIDIKRIQSIIDDPVFDLNERQEGLSLLDHAVKRDLSKVCRIFLDSPKMDDETIHRALLIATAQANVSITGMLIDTDKLSQDVKDEALIKAVWSCESGEPAKMRRAMTICRLLMKAGAEPSQHFMYEEILGIMNNTFEVGYKLLNFFLEMGVDATDVDSEHGDNIIMTAEYTTPDEESWDKVIKLLLKYNINLDFNDNPQASAPLMEMASKGRLDYCKLFVEHGADVTLVDYNNYFISSDKYDPEIEAYFKEQKRLAYGDAIASISSKKKRVPFAEKLAARSAVSKPEQTKLKKEIFQAVLKNDIEAVKEGVKKGFDLNYRGDYPSGCLHWLRLSECVEIGNYFIEQGADVNLRDEDNKTPLFFARSTEWSNSLLAHGADVNAVDDDGNTPLHCIRTEALAMVLIKHGANIHAKNKDDETALHRVRFNAYSDDRLALIRCLLKHKIDVNAATLWGVTALHIFVSDDDLESCKLLLSHGANINQANIYGKTALHLAAQRENREMIQFLLSKGANPILRCGVNRKPLAYTHNFKIREILIEAESEFSAKTTSGSVSKSVSGHKRGRTEISSDSIASTATGTPLTDIILHKNNKKARYTELEMAPGK